MSSINIALKLYASLTEFFPEKVKNNKLDIQLQSDTTVADVLLKFVCVVMWTVNRVHRASYGLVDGDRSVATSTHQQPREHTTTATALKSSEPTVSRRTSYRTQPHLSARPSPTFAGYRPTFTPPIRTTFRPSSERDAGRGVTA